MKKGSTTEQLRVLFRKATCRFPNEKELQRLQQYYAEQLKDFQADEARCRKYLVIKEGDAKTDLASWAALSVVSNLILNLDEAIERG
jgi:hypothetical protein